MAMTLKAVAPLDAEAALPMQLLLQHLKDPEDEELVVSAARAGALGWLEKRVGISLTRRAWRVTFSGFPRHVSAIQLPMGPTSVDSVAYKGSGLDPQVWPAESYTLDGYVLRTSNRAPWSASFADMAVAVDYQAGYTDLASEEPALQTAALLLAGHFYRNREENAAAVLASMPFGVAMLIEDIRFPVMA